MTNIINKINSPKDLKNLSIDDFKILAWEMREALIKKTNTVWGHFWPNLWMVEATIAMHYVFNSPIDKFVFDVSHQSYPHKMLTWRMEAFTNPEKYSSVGGYTDPKESEHDYFFTWHTSTSVSLAAWLAKARDLKWDKENIIAIIWDWSLSWWEAYEWLNNAAVLNSNIIVIVNDNDMSIAENHWWLYQNLAALRKNNWEVENNFFKSLWFDYYFIKDWHNFEELISTFEKVKDSDHPVLVHMCTTKWKGFEYAEKNKEPWHFIMPWMADNPTATINAGENYATITRDYILDKIRTDKTVIGMTAWTPMLDWFTPEYRNQAWMNYIDVGIAEQTEVAMASWIAKNGWKPIAGIASSFIQRTYDQLSHDLALNSNPATILVSRNWISWSDATHLWVFDIPLISNIPNIVYLAPTTKEEYLAMLDWSVEQKDYPVAIRIPSWQMISTWIQDKTDYSILNRFEITNSWNEIAIIWLWAFYHLAGNVKKLLDEKLGINTTLINPKFISWIDKEILENLKSTHKIVITLEDGVLDGWFGEKISRFYGPSDMKVLNYGATKDFTNRIPVKELYERFHLTPELILQDIRTILK